MGLSNEDIELIFNQALRRRKFRMQYKKKGASRYTKRTLEFYSIRVYGIRYGNATRIYEFLYCWDDNRGGENRQRNHIRAYNFTRIRDGSVRSSIRKYRSVKWNIEVN
ncbi:hypothetical protein CMI37_38640 [Candidatus Pacearchaeota archaeon]|jgi:hypothetical protein|nr:hypothetical protein [Candidatus Pacearchaeota archaeon]